MEDFDNDIRMAVECLRKGGVILYPTDTVWGLGCDASQESAVRKIFEIKRRAESKALISLVADMAMLERYVDDAPEVAFSIAELADRPTTIIYDRPRGLAPSLLAADGSAGIRVTSERYSRELCRRLGRAIVSTSANVSGSPAPAFFAEIAPEITGAADYVAEYRRNDRTQHTPSTVIKIQNDSSFLIIRK